MQDVKLLGLVAELKPVEATPASEDCTSAAVLNRATLFDSIWRYSVRLCGAPRGRKRHDLCSSIAAGSMACCEAQVDSRQATGAVVVYYGPPGIFSMQLVRR
jgi:hypothetical protein